MAYVNKYSGLKYKHEYPSLKYEYKYKYWDLKYEYKYKYFKIVLEYNSSTSTSTKYYKSGLEPTTSYSIHFFTQSLSSFRNTRPYHRNLFCCSTDIIPTVPNLVIKHYINLRLLLRVCNMPACSCAGGAHRHGVQSASKAARRMPPPANLPSLKSEYQRTGVITAPPVTDNTGQYTA